MWGFLVVGASCCALAFAAETCGATAQQNETSQPPSHPLLPDLPPMVHGWLIGGLLTVLTASCGFVGHRIFSGWTRLRYTTVKVSSTSVAFQWLTSFLARHPAIVERETNLDLYIGQDCSEQKDSWYHRHFGVVGEQKDTSVNFRPSSGTSNIVLVFVPHPEERERIRRIVSVNLRLSEVEAVRKAGNGVWTRVIIQPFERELKAVKEDSPAKEQGFTLSVANPSWFKLWHSSNAIDCVRWFVTFAEWEHSKQEYNRQQLFVSVTRYDAFWRQLASRPRRSLNTIHLPKEQLHDIVSDIQWFLDSRDWYKERGIPYRRGYLLYGKPGCGKSSFIFALAGRFDMPICILDLTGKDRISDASLNILVNSAPPQSILLVEEVDTLFTDKKKAKGDGGDDDAKLSKADKFSTEARSKAPKKAKKDIPSEDQVKVVRDLLDVIRGKSAVPTPNTLVGMSQQTVALLLEMETILADGDLRSELTAALEKYGFDTATKKFPLPVESLQSLVDSLERSGVVHLNVSLSDTKTLRGLSCDISVKALEKDIEGVLESLEKLLVNEAADEKEYTETKSCRIPEENCICSFQGLLQAMDGVTAQEGRVVIFTTNHKEKLDPALIRPGRIDRQFEFRNGNVEQVEDMFTRFFASRREGASVELSHLLIKTKQPLDVLHTAIRTGRTQPSLVLIEVGTEPPPSPVTLSLAVDAGMGSVVEALLLKGVRGGLHDVKRCVEEGNEAIALAVMANHPTGDMASGGKVLHAAIKRGYTLLARELMQGGVPADDFALMLAIEQGDDTELVAQLINHGAQPSLETLSEAVAHARAGTVQCLVDAGVEPTSELILDAITASAPDAMDREAVESTMNNAARFAGILAGPGGKRTEFSLAQVQGYLTTKAREPDPQLAACEGAAEYFGVGGSTCEDALTRQHTM
eukprot:Sspe_Gene.7680::Locus_2600_Transcript_9_10_Confidence_0.148_Length_2979::g.7680::m.7680